MIRTNYSCLEVWDTDVMDTLVSEADPGSLVDVMLERAREVLLFSLHFMQCVHFRPDFKVI